VNQRIFVGNRLALACFPLGMGLARVHCTQPGSKPKLNR
jgi:hypothetical protein